MSHHFIKFTDVSYVYPDGTKAVDHINLHIRHGERVALLGRNGAGKSTILLMTNGLLMSSSGEVNIGDVPISRRTLPIVRQSVGMVFQNPDDQLFMPTVEEDVAFGPLNMQLEMPEVRRRVEKALKSVGAYELRRRSPMQLSGGQKRRVAIATVLSMEPSILVLDEPTSNLDLHARRELINVLNDFDHTMFIATHDLEMVRLLCPRTIIVGHGRIFADGSTEQLLDDPEVRSIIGLD